MQLQGAGEVGLAPSEGSGAVTDQGQNAKGCDIGAGAQGPWKLQSSLPRSGPVGAVQPEVRLGQAEAGIQGGPEGAFVGQEGLAES